ncbi:MAG: cache domain-containing protein, partial [Smithellaceae bacterium]|nr:cache domain-containing protein [Smithellaceae bacterium]
MAGKQGKKIFAVNMQVSIWMTTIAVIILILLFAVTINRARERDMAEQFGRQQAAIARGMASGMEDLVVSVEKSIIMLSRLPVMEKMNAGDALQSMKVIYENLEGKVELIAVVDSKGEILSGYPSDNVRDILGANLSRYDFFRAIKATSKPYVGEVISPGGVKTVVVGVPRNERAGNFSGVIIATLSISSVLDRYVKQGKGVMPSVSMMVNSEGKVLLHPDERLVGTDIGALETRALRSGDSLKAALLKGKEDYGEYFFKGSGDTVERNLVVYAPVHLGNQVWSVAVVSPYNRVIALVRKTFINTMVGAIAVIFAVIIASFSIAYSSRKRLQMKEELERLREREDWEERLIREKKTIEGIIEGSPIPTFVINKDHRVILWNRACTELTGYDASEMIGTDRHFAPFYPQQRPVIADLIVDRDIGGLAKYYGTKKVRRSTTVKGAYEARDFYDNLGGKSRYLYFLAAPIYDEKGEIIAAIETLQDISREMDMSRSLKEYAETLQNELSENINLRKENEALS